MGSASLAAARPAARPVTTIPLQPGGLRGKKPPNLVAKILATKFGFVPDCTDTEICPQLTLQYYMLLG